MSTSDAQWAVRDRESFESYQNIRAETAQGHGIFKFGTKAANLHSKVYNSTNNSSIIYCKSVIKLLWQILRGL